MAKTEPQAMTSERLAVIRARHEQTPGSSLAKTQREIAYAFFDRAELLEEVERQRDVLDAMSSSTDPKPKQPMSERMVGIRAWRDGVTDEGRRTLTWRLINDMVSEVEQAWAREAAMADRLDAALEIVQVVAEATITVSLDGQPVTFAINATWPCLQEQARALLASASEEGERHDG